MIKSLAATSLARFVKRRRLGAFAILFAASVAIPSGTEAFGATDDLSPREDEPTASQFQPFSTGPDLDSLLSSVWDARGREPAPLELSLPPDCLLGSSLVECELERRIAFQMEMRRLHEEEATLVTCSASFSRQFLPDYASLRGLGDLDRLHAIDQIKAVVGGLVELVRDDLLGVGVAPSSVRASWLAGAVLFELPHENLAMLSSVLANDLIDDISFADAKIEPYDWSGNALKQGLNAYEFLSQGYNGSLGNRALSSTPIRVAITEFGSYAPSGSGIGGVPNYPHRDHVSFRTPSGGSRFKKIQRCDSSSCWDISTTMQPYMPHGQIVTWTMGASIMAGQDSAFTGTDTSAQRLRSGIASGVDIYFYNLVATASDNGSLCSAAKAVEAAFAQGADIVNMSWGIDGACTQAMANVNFCSFNSLIENATDGGLLFVAAAGNSGIGNSGCTLGYPATRPQVVTVGSLTTNAGLIYDQTVEDYSSWGGIPTTVKNWGSSTTTGVDLVAPGGSFDYISWVPNNSGSSSYNTSSTSQGTSFASPAVVGSAALLKHSLHLTGWHNSKNVPGRLKAALSMQGDGMLESYPSGLVQTSSEFGHGRLRNHHNTSYSLQTPFAWGMGTATLLSTGGYYDVPINGGSPLPSGVKGIKASFNWWEYDYLDISDVIVELRNTCAPGNVVLKSDYTTNMTKFLRHIGDVSGACLLLRIYPLSLSSTINLDYSWFFWGEVSAYEY